MQRETHVTVRVRYAQDLLTNTGKCLKCHSKAKRSGLFIWRVSYEGDEEKRYTQLTPEA